MLSKVSESLLYCLSSFIKWYIDVKLVMTVILESILDS